MAGAMTTEVVRESTTHRCTLPEWAMSHIDSTAVCATSTCRRVWEHGIYGWRRTDQVEPMPGLPAPEVPARDATDAETPTGARRLAAAAQGHGWTVRVTYARGTWRGTRGPDRIVESVAVRFRRAGDFAGWAVWRDGKFAEAQLGMVRYGLRDLTAALAAATDVSGRPAAGAPAAPAGSKGGEVVRLTGADQPAIPTRAAVMS